MSVQILTGDCLATMATLPDGAAQCCVTSPPYWNLRDYGCEGQIGLEDTPEAYVARLVDVFREVRRVLANDGTLWLNLGDSYGKGKQLQGIPWRVAFALQADGWYLRSEIIWHKPNPMPESVRDRPTSAHEKVFLLAKSGRYFYDAPAVREANSNPKLTECQKHWTERPGNGEWPSGTGGRMGSVKNGRNARNVWTIAPKPYRGAHFAVMPPALAERCIKAGSRPGDTVLDPFGGAGTTALAAQTLGRNAILCELNPEYSALADARLAGEAGALAGLVP